MQRQRFRITAAFRGPPLTNVVHKDSLRHLGNRLKEVVSIGEVPHLLRVSRVPHDVEIRLIRERSGLTSVRSSLAMQARARDRSS